MLRWDSSTGAPAPSTILTCSSSTLWASRLWASSTSSVMPDTPEVSYKGCPAPTWSTCSSELVLLARSAAVVAARLASLEPSVAKRILVGKILIECSPRLSLASRLYDATSRGLARSSENPYLLGSSVNKGKKRKGSGQNSSTGPHRCFAPRSRTPRPSEVAELARIEPLQHQLEGLRANS